MKERRQSEVERKFSWSFFQKKKHKRAESKVKLSISPLEIFQSGYRTSQESSSSENRRKKKGPKEFRNLFMSITISSHFTILEFEVEFFELFFSRISQEIGNNSEEFQRIQVIWPWLHCCTCNEEKKTNFMVQLFLHSLFGVVRVLISSHKATRTLRQSEECKLWVGRFLLYHFVLFTSPESNRRYEEE